MSIGIFHLSCVFTIWYCLQFCSGTLSYIFNNFKDGRAFSGVVTEAKEAGYTEPDPRDDLSGTDVARKVNYTVLNIFTKVCCQLLVKYFRAVDN